MLSLPQKDVRSRYRQREGRMKQDSVKPDQVKLSQDFGTFRISADGRDFVRDLALLQALIEEMQQEVVTEKVALDAVHVMSMPQYAPASYSTLA